MGQALGCGDNLAMGLSVKVGYLADLIANDPEVAQRAFADLEAINTVLHEKDLQAHVEPTDCELWSRDVCGYEGLNPICEIAGMIHLGHPIPREIVFHGAETKHADALRKTFFEHVSGKGQMTLVGRAFRSIFKAKEKPKLPDFVHLVVHSGWDGLYVPIEFELPLVPGRKNRKTDHVWPLGSVFRLEREVNDLARHLEIPSDLKSTDEDTIEKYWNTPNTSPDAPLWQAQMIAAENCLILREACEMSLRTGGAIHFVERE